MAAGRTIGAFVLGLIGGGVAGGGLGLVCGLAWTALAGTSGFEGYAGFVVGWFLIAGLFLGLVVGPVLALRLFRR